MDREKSKIELKKYIKYDSIIDIIENSIYDFTNTFIKNNNIEVSLFDDIYTDKLHDICINLDINKNEEISEILFKNNNLEKIAFLSPSELHPSNWKNIIDKLNTKYNAENNITTTDIYTCHKCGKKKCTVMQKQTRSADEAATTFVICQNCKNVFRTY